MSEMQLGVTLIYGIFYFFMFAFCIAMYVLNSLALQKIANRRQIKNAWLAWIPIGTEWILGSIADEYESHQGKDPKFRKKLMGFAIAMNILYVFLITAFVGGIILMIINLRELDEVALFTFILGVAFVYLLVFGLAITYSVFYYISLYKLFLSTDSKNAVLYIVLCILVPLALPICLTICKNKGYSIPPQPNYTQPNQNYNQPTYY